MRPLSLREKEYREELFRLERRAIIPLKWAILSVTFLLWAGFYGSWPAKPAIALFACYATVLVAQSAWFYFGTIPSGQIRRLTLASYLMDVIFVTMLIYFDLTTTYFGTETHGNFYILCFLLVMRGFALFKTIGETIFVNLLISVLFVLMNYLERPDLKNLLNPDFTQSLILIWLVILMSWFVVVTINRQKTEMLEVHDRLMRAESLARVGELAAGVAHEINNPIGIIATTADYLRRSRTINPAELNDELRAIENEAMRCKEIVQQMLTYANPRPTGKAPLDLRALNGEVLDFVFPPNRPSRFTVLREHDPDAPLVEADPNLIKQALLNLYLNARQACPKDAPGRIVSRVMGRRHLLRVEIEDDGPGVADEDMDRVFEPFFTLKEKGTGLGLAVTQRIVESFGGTISVESAKPHGAIFILEFPAAGSDG